MEIMLLEDVAKLGSRGEIVKVADGYARNYLIPRKLAVKVDMKNKKMLENEKRKLEVMNRKRQEAQQEVATQLNELELEFTERANEGVLYGSVSHADIVKELDKKGFDIDARHILLEDNIKTVGTHSVSVRLKDGIQANLTIHVIGEE